MVLPAGVSLNSGLPLSGAIRAVSEGRCSRSQQPIAAIREQNREQLWSGVGRALRSGGERAELVEALMLPILRIKPYVQNNSRSVFRDVVCL